MRPPISGMFRNNEVATMAQIMGPPDTTQTVSAAKAAQLLDGLRAFNDRRHAGSKHRCNAHDVTIDEDFRPGDTSKRSSGPSLALFAPSFVEIAFFLKFLGFFLQPAIGTPMANQLALSRRA
jgi:hypothetical protein